MHLCPSADYGTLEIAQLRQLMSADPRIAVKVKIMEQLCMVFAREQDESVKSGYLTMIYAYMKLYSIYEEIVEPGLREILRVSQQPGGTEYIVKTIPEVWMFARNNRCKGSLRPIGTKLMEVHDAMESLTLLSAGV